MRSVYLMILSGLSILFIWLFLYREPLIATSLSICIVSILFLTLILLQFTYSDHRQTYDNRPVYEYRLINFNSIETPTELYMTYTLENK
jgi:hypothetical protein